MATMLLRFAAPLQSWGTDKFERRGTENIPTKSGVVGLLAAALGRRRSECDDMHDLLSLRFGVRVERSGGLLRDFHTAKSATDAYVTNRYYLSDAVFLVALEGDEVLLNDLAKALRSPAFPLFLGRRSCPPEGKVFIKILMKKNFREALEEAESLAPENKTNISERRIVLDAEPGDKDVYQQRDVPLSFNQTRRRYGFRRVTEPRRQEPDHDPMREIE